MPGYKLVLSSALVALSLGFPAFAGTDHDHGPRYGGIAKEVSNITYELVVKADLITLYVSDHGKPISTDGAKAEATIYAGNEKTAVTLEPAGENRLAAKGSFKGGVGVRVALTVTLAGKSQDKVTFNLK